MRSGSCGAPRNWRASEHWRNPCETCCFCRRSRTAADRSRAFVRQSERSAQQWTKPKKPRRRLRFWRILPRRWLHRRRLWKSTVPRWNSWRNWNSARSIKCRASAAGQPVRTTGKPFRSCGGASICPWEEELLEQWLAAFTAAVQAGRNPIMEKYARMMESTDPQLYAGLCRPAAGTVAGICAAAGGSHCHSDSVDGGIHGKVSASGQPCPCDSYGGGFHGTDFLRNLSPRGTFGVSF